MVQLPRNNDLSVALFEKMLDPAYLTNSYKLYWFSAVFEEVVIQLMLMGRMGFINGFHKLKTI